VQTGDDVGDDDDDDEDDDDDDGGNIIYRETEKIQRGQKETLGSETKSKGGMGNFGISDAAGCYSPSVAA